MWVGNPSQPKVFRSPSYQAGKFPFDLDSVPVNLSPRRNVSQFGKFMDVDTLNHMVPGPIIRDQAIRNRNYAPTFNNIGYPGLLEPDPSDIVPGTVFKYVGKHYSNTLYYNQQFPLNLGYGASPYWRFSQWANDFPEYFILDAQAVNAVGQYIVGADDFGNPTYLPITLGHYGATKWLLRRTSGYLFGPNATGSFYDQMLDTDYAGCATWVPVYDITNRRFPPPDCQFQLRFGPFRNSIPGTTTPDGDVASVGPACWHLMFVVYNNIETTNFLEFKPPPTSGQLSFKYDGLVSAPVTIPNTGVAADDAEALRQLLENRIGNLGTISTIVTTVELSVDRWYYSIVIDHSAYSALTLETNTVFPSAVTVYENTSFDRGFLGKSADIVYMTPTPAFNKPEGACKDTRTIGDFGTIGPFDPTGTNLIPFGEQATFDGQSYGALSSKASVRFALRHWLLDALLNSDTNFYEYPGWPIPYPYFWHDVGFETVHETQPLLIPLPSL